MLNSFSIYLQVISLFGEIVTGAGLSSIRAYKLEDEWRERFYALVDDWTVRFVLFRYGTSFFFFLNTFPFKEREVSGHR
jgi:hypothetical protein